MADALVGHTRGGLAQVNVFNSVNFRLPNNNLSSAQFGQITQVVENNQRIIQIGLKVLF